MKKVNFGALLFVLIFGIVQITLELLGFSFEMRLMLGVTTIITMQALALFKDME